MKIIPASMIFIIKILYYPENYSDIIYKIVLLVRSRSNIKFIDIRKHAASSGPFSSLQY